MEEENKKMYLFGTYEYGRYQIENFSKEDCEINASKIFEKDNFEEGLNDDHNTLDRYWFRII